MANKLGICLFCRHAFTIRSFSYAPKRFYARREREPYVLPRLVIDLDAADSKHVRPIEELVEWKPDINPAKTPRESRGPILKYKPKIKRGFNPNQVIATDLLTFALLGDRSPSSGVRTLPLRNVCRALRIPESDDGPSKVRQLVSEYILSDQRFKLHARKHHVAGELEWISAKGGFSHLKRLVSMVSTTKLGCEFLGRLRWDLWLAIQSCRRRQWKGDLHREVSSEMVLVLYNNLRISVAKRANTSIGTESLAGAHHYAVKVWNLPSIRRYLYELRDDPERNAKTKDFSLTTFIQGLVVHPERRAGITGVESIKLITGWNPVEGQEIKGERSISFPLAFPRHYPATSHCYEYIVGLGELGLSEILMAEFNEHLTPPLFERNWMRSKDDEPINLKVYVFALCLQLAGNTDSALPLLQSHLKTEGPRKHSKQNKSSYEPQAPPDTPNNAVTSTTNADDHTAPKGLPLFPNSNLYDSGSATLQALYRWHHRYHSLDPVERLQTIIEAEIDALLSSPRRLDPQVVIDTFEKFIVRDFVAPPMGEGYSRMQLHWLDDGGVRGLVVLAPDEGVDEEVGGKGRPLFWKPVVGGGAEGDAADKLRTELGVDEGDDAELEAGAHEDEDSVDIRS